MSYKKILPVIILTSILSVAGLLYVGIQGDNAQMPAALSFLSNNMHTGLITNPGTQLALKDKDENSNQYAQKIPSNNQVAILNNNPTVLFDISAQPLFGKSSQMNLILLLSIIAASLLTIGYFLRKIYKHNKFQKIRNIK